MLDSRLLRSHQAYPESLRLWKHRIHRVQLPDHFQTINRRQSRTSMYQSRRKGEDILHAENSRQPLLFVDIMFRHAIHLIPGGTPTVRNFHPHSVPNYVHEVILTTIKW